MRLEFPPGYDIDTPVEDIHLFLDRLQTSQIILAGHSRAEMLISVFPL